MARIRALEPSAVRPARSRAVWRLAYGAGLAAALVAFAVMGGHSSVWSRFFQPSARRPVAVLSAPAGEEPGRARAQTEAAREPSPVAEASRTEASGEVRSVERKDTGLRDLAQGFKAVGAQAFSRTISASPGRLVTDSPRAPIALAANAAAQAATIPQRTFAALAPGIPAHDSSVVDYVVDLVVEVPDLPAAARQLERVAVELQGIASPVVTEVGGRWEYEVRVPLRLANVATVAFASLGELKAKQVTMQDFSEALAEIDSRIAYLNGQIGWTAQAMEEPQVQAAIAALRKRRHEILAKTSTVTIRVAMLGRPTDPMSERARLA